MCQENSEEPTVPEPKPKLRRMKPLQEADLANLSPVHDTTHDKAEPLSLPGKTEMHKYFKPISQGEPDFMADMQELAASEEPPLYSTQGEDVGRKRGRKPKTSNGKATNAKSKKGKKTTKGGKKHRKGKGNSKVHDKGTKSKPTSSKDTKSPSKGAKSPSKRVQKAKRVRKAHAAVKASQEPQPAQPVATPARKRPAARPPAPPDAEASDAKPYLHGPRRVPPKHVTANHVYSSAYRRHTKYGVEFAKAAANLAAQYFRESGMVDDLCGVFRETPRASKALDKDVPLENQNEGM